ncbi:type II toxin-antitoxin system Phd/YefM family antitoxin [Silvibacterium acidisoli]
MEVKVHEAKTRLSQFIVKAEGGEKVIIARNGEPAVRSVPLTPVTRTLCA